jgi:hypothetical protein
MEGVAERVWLVWRAAVVLGETDPDGWRRSGGCEVVSVELEEVVGGGQQPPFGSDC